MTGKKVGITCSKEKYANTYAEAVRWAGAEPVFIIPGTDLSTLDGLDGLVLTGGSDINPDRYGEGGVLLHPETGEPNNARDEMEFALTAKFIKLNKPILAICRGQQMLNVVRGGTLNQHLETVDHHRVNTNPGDDKSAMAHTVKLRPKTKLAKIIGETTEPYVAVNSRHHQAVDKLGKGLRISAYAEDGTIEGVELQRKKFVIAVQWHPENQLENSEASRRLFRAFAAAL
jgi:putative glutamine amidotransferase